MRLPSSHSTPKSAAALTHGRVRRFNRSTDQPDGLHNYGLHLNCNASVSLFMGEKDKKIKPGSASAGRASESEPVCFSLENESHLLHRRRELHSPLSSRTGRAARIRVLFRPHSPDSTDKSVFNAFSFGRPVTVRDKFSRTRLNEEPNC